MYIPLLTYLCSSPEEAIHTGVQHSNTVLVTVKSWDIFSLMCFFECPSWSVGKWQRWWRGIMWEEMTEIHKGIKWRVIMWVKDLWLNFGQGSTLPDNTCVKFERLTSFTSTYRNLKKVGRNVEEFTCSSLSVVVLFLSEGRGQTATCLSPSSPTLSCFINSAFLSQSNVPTKAEINASICWKLCWLISLADACSMEVSLQKNYKYVNHLLWV